MYYKGTGNKAQGIGRNSASYLAPCSCIIIFAKSFRLKHISRYFSYILLLVSYLVTQTSCTDVNVFEKNVTIPNHSWSSHFKPEITFTVAPEDTLSRYKIYIVLRHSDAYRFKNIWINIHTESPNGVTRNQPLDLQLATDDRGWLGSGMDDLFEHRIMITAPGDPLPLHAGTYKFKLENIMREDPLNHVWNVGIRLEKAQ